MLTNDGSQILTAAIAKNAANDNFVLSKRVAILRNCLRRLNIRSMRLRSLYALKSQEGGSLRFAFGGMTGKMPWISNSSRIASLS